MELVYLWVEKYKNIENQGFNFSPRFECEYDENTNELTIDEKKDYVSIFPDNINVTAIVGENGSGKSSVFEILAFLYWKGNVKRDDKTFFLYKKGTKFFIQCENMKFKYKSKLEEFLSFKNLTDIDSPATFCARGRMPLISFFNCMSDMTNNKSLKSLKTYDKFYGGIQPSKPLQKSKDIYDNFNQKLRYILNEQASLFDFLDARFNFDSYRIEVCISELETLFYMDEDNKEFEKLLTFQSSEKLLKEETIYKFFIHISIQMAFEKVYNSTHKSLSPNTANVDILKKFINDNFKTPIIGLPKDNYDKKYFEDVLKILSNGLHKIGEILESNIFNVKIFDSYELEEAEEPSHNQLLSTMYSMNSSDELNSIEGNALTIWLLNNNILRVNFFNDNNLEYNFLSLSSGEKNFINLMTNFSYTLFKLEKSYKGIMIFDEVELSFHPQWQKNIIYSLLKIYERVENKVDLHLIFTTHSPFLLSDMPKENMIFLEKGKQVYPDIQTFGANIHTLLSHGFFMKDGLMGEFAKGKIEYIRKFYNKVIKYQKDEKVKKVYRCFYTKKQKDFEHIQKIIGESFLKTIVKNQLEEIETILFEDNAREMAIKRYIEEFGENEIRKVLENATS